MGLNPNEIKIGEFRVVKSVHTSGEERLIQITDRRNNDLVRFVAGRCVMTGEKVTHGLYTEEQLENVGPPLSEMEVLAWCAK